MLYLDELARFIEMMNAYRSSGGDRQAYLDLRGNGSVDQQRVSRGRTFKKCKANRCWDTSSPTMVSELFTAINGGDGFWAR